MGLSKQDNKLNSIYFLPNSLLIRWVHIYFELNGGSELFGMRIRIELFGLWNEIYIKPIFGHPEVYDMNRIIELMSILENLIKSNVKN